MGAVYHGRRLSDGADVALKLLHDERHAARFESEARLLSRLRHPRVARVLDDRSHGARRCLVMELVRGPSLARVLDRARPAAGRRGARVRAPAVRGAGLRACAAGRAPRRQAGQRHPRRARRRARRLRHRARHARRRRRRDGRDRHAGVHGARGAGGRRGLAAHGRVRLGRDAVDARGRQAAAVSRAHAALRARGRRRSYGRGGGARGPRARPVPAAAVRRRVRRRPR